MMAGENHQGKSWNVSWSCSQSLPHVCVTDKRASGFLYYMYQSGEVRWHRVYNVLSCKGRFFFISGCSGFTDTYFKQGEISRKGKYMNTKLIKILAAGSMALALAGCSSSSDTSSSSDDSSSSDKATEILIGISPDYPPYESKNTDGEIEGFDVDMTEWLFNWLNENGYNYTYEFKELSFDTIITSLQAGQIDLGISGFTYDADREGIFSDSYYDSAQVIVVRADSDITSSADLNGKDVGAQQGATGEEAAESIEGANVTALQDVKVLMETLKADGLDAVVLDRAVAVNYAASGEYKVLDEVLMDEENIIYSTEEHQELMDEINEAIAAFKASDDYTTLTEKWFDSDSESAE